MTEERSSYRQIMKATSIFGGVQVINIIIQIIRSKFIAVLLGAAGMGIMGLLNSTLDIIASLTEFGLGTSAVKDVAAANSAQNTQRISIVITVFRRLVWITGTLGTLLTLFLSPWLSQLTFGNRDYIVAFIWISITLIFKQLSNGQLVILQGLRKLKHLAKASLWGSAVGLLVTLPLYYFFGIDGIVPGIISTSLVSLFFSWVYSRKVNIEPISISNFQTIDEGKSMLQMGFMISLGGLLTVGASYIVRIFISRTGGVDQVGLYNAGFAIINTYVGLVFTAMSTDYYPRLSAVAHDNKLCKQTINQQAEIAILILAPILVVFLTFINWLIILLYSRQFIAVNGMIYWAVLGIFFKAATWAIGFLFLAKGDGKVFFWSELASNIFTLILNILGYRIWGLTGLGISFLVAYIIGFCQVYLINRIKYNFTFDPQFIRIFIFQFVLAFIAFFAVLNLSKTFHYLIGVTMISVSGWYSIKELNKRLEILSLIKKYKRN